MSIDFSNRTKNLLFRTIDIQVKRNDDEEWIPITLLQGNSSPFDDLEKPLIVMKFKVEQELLKEIPLSVDLKYKTGCVDYTLHSLTNNAEIKNPTTTGDPITIDREYEVILVKRNHCPDEGQTHIDVNIKHPPGSGG